MSCIFCDMIAHGSKEACAFSGAVIGAAIAIHGRSPSMCPTHRGILQEVLGKNGMHAFQVTKQEHQAVHEGHGSHVIILPGKGSASS